MIGLLIIEGGMTWTVFLAAEPVSFMPQCAELPKTEGPTSVLVPSLHLLLSPRETCVSVKLDSGLSPRLRTVCCLQSPGRTARARLL